MQITIEIVRWLIEVRSIHTGMTTAIRKDRAVQTVVTSFGNDILNSMQKGVCRVPNQQEKILNGFCISLRDVVR